MNISDNWLRKYIKTDLSVDEIAALLTDIGLEVESVEKVEAVKGALEGLIIAEVIEKEKHPDADRLSITRVNTGTETLQIVCGAANVAQGQKVVVALDGAILYPSNGESFKIKKSKIRGVESNGMICAEDEIGLGTSHDGIMVLDANAKVGIPAAEYFNLKSDFIYSIGLTPNRVDAASHFGVARDLYAVLKNRNHQAELIFPDLSSFKTGKKSPSIAVEIKSKENCKRYSGILISNIQVAPSPEWLQTSLRSIGLRPINNIVDITNFVLHELGQPLHAFDADQISGKKIIVKNAQEGSKFVTLDQSERTLSSSNLMIADAEKDLCLAGIMGGKFSGVNENTKTIFLESAYFDAVCIRKSARAHALNTDSSFRFERGADPEMVISALKRAAILIQEICNATIEEELIDIYPVSINPTVINFSLNRCFQLIGQEIPLSELKSILNDLEIQIVKESTTDLELKIPAYRVDVLRDVDVVEEILRIYGYNRITIPSKINASVNHRLMPDRDRLQDVISDLLASNGFSETLSNSLTNESYAQLINSDAVNASLNVELLNPLSSELSVLRQSLLFSGLEAIRYNLNRQQNDLKFFEFGKIYFKKNNFFEEFHQLALFTTGKLEPENWTSSGRSTSFYEIKSAVGIILERLGLMDAVRIIELKNDIFSDGMSYEIAKKKIVDFGWVRLDLLSKMDVKQKVFYAEFNWDAIVSVLHFNKIKYKEISKFPMVRRDLSLLINNEIRFDQIEKLAREADKKILHEVGLFDVYEGKNLETGKKSYAVSLQFKDDSQTLTDEKIDSVMSKIIQSLESQLGAQLR